MFQYWGFGEWFLSLWFICHFITFLGYIVAIGKDHPEHWIYASLFIAFTWPIIWFFIICAIVENKKWRF